MDWKNLLTAENITLFGTVIGSVLATAYLSVKTFLKKIDREKKTDNDVPKKVEKQSAVDSIINKKMEEIKELLNADRVQIYEFHNGVHYANGRSALKTTCTYEVCRSGIVSYLRDLENIPLSCIPHFTEQLLNDGKMAVKDIEDIKDTMPSTYELKTRQGVKSYYDVVLRNQKFEPIGFVGIQFCENKYNIDEEEVMRFVGFVEEALSSIL